MIVGTAHFKNRSAAERYYLSQGYETMADAIAAVTEKLAEGAIRIGKPNVGAGERLLLIDNGTRYAIEAKES